MLSNIFFFRVSGIYWSARCLRRPGANLRPGSGSSWKNKFSPGGVSENLSKSDPELHRKNYVFFQICWDDFPAFLRSFLSIFVTFWRIFCKYIEIELMVEQETKILSFYCWFVISGHPWQPWTRLNSVCIQAWAGQTKSLSLCNRRVLLKWRSS